MFLWKDRNYVVILQQLFAEIRHYNNYIVNKAQLKLLSKHKIRNKRLKPEDVKIAQPKAYDKEKT